MKNILVIGAGRTSTYLINYLLKQAKENQWFVTVADVDPELATTKVNGHPNGRGTWLDVLKPNDRRELMQRNDIIISMLPSNLHFRIAKDCIKLKKQLVTSAYVARTVYGLNPEIIDASLSFMSEMGLDPGVEQMSMMQKVNQIKEKGGKISSLRTYSGGLIAPECDDNPWHYKFSWHPRNVILAGQGTSQYLVKGRYKFIPYSRLFTQYRLVEIPGMGTLEAYANRDSLLYRDLYGLKNIPTLKSSTLHYPGFCDAWHALVRLGLTDDSYPILESENMTYREYIEAHLDVFRDSTASLKERTAQFLGLGPSSEIIKRLEWLGLFDRRKIGIPSASPAKILQHLLEKKWNMKPKDKDMVVIQHVIKYKLKGKKMKSTSTMTLKGNNAENTAMAKFVGLPIGIFVKHIIKGNISETGVRIPIDKNVYTPVLEELEEYGIVFNEVIEEI